MKALQTLAAATLALATTLAFAAPEVSGPVTIKGNSAKKITAQGGSGSVGIGFLRGGNVDMSAEANVNSVVVRDGKITGRVSIIDNSADEVTVTGGTANVNSLIVGK